MVSVFMKGPIDAYISGGRRAALTDTADTTVRRIARDIRKALPNSIRSAGRQCVEFIPTKTGGRYRADDTAAGLSFGLPADTAINMLGSNTAGIPADQQIANQDLVVVYNLGIPGSDAYSQTNTALINAAPTPAGSASAPETAISITPASSPTFPLESPSHRFQVIPGDEQVVRYVCVGATGTNAQGDGSGVLYRQVLTLPLAAGASCPATVTGAAVMASRVSACSFDYSGSDLQRNALLIMTFVLTEQNETVTLQHEVHVDNTP
jgi:MSHA biogenesis protein MshO